MRRINKINDLTMTLIILTINRITITRIKISVWLSRNRSSRTRLNHLLNPILKSIYFSVMIIVSFRRLNQRRRVHQIRINAIPRPVNHKKRQNNQQTKNIKETQSLHSDQGKRRLIVPSAAGGEPGNLEKRKDGFLRYISCVKLGG